MDRWWVIHEDEMMSALERVATGDVTPEEALAVLMENVEVEQASGSDRD